MIVELEKNNKTLFLPELASFGDKLSKLSSKKDVAFALIETLNTVFNAKFSSFVERDSNSLKVVCQSGESNSINNVFDKEISHQIFDWVIKQKQLANLKLDQKDQFIFVPLVDNDLDQNIEHGMLVFYLSNDSFTLSKNLSLAINILVRLATLSMSKLSKRNDIDKYLKSEEQNKRELVLTTKIQKSILNSSSSNKISFKVLEDESSCFSGNLWWVSELDPDITLVLIAEVQSDYEISLNYKSSSSAMLIGYLLGEMNSLKTRAEISLNPKQVLNYLNHQLNSIFKNTGITVNAWYGVFNMGARKVRFSNANHVDPFVIGPEQQVSNLVISSQEKGKPLGQSLNSIFTESVSQLSSGSKLIICTKDLLEHASKIGDKYDPTWLPHVLETLGTLSLGEMTNSLKSILSENSNGTAQKPSRLALLLEIPS